MMHRANGSDCAARDLPPAYLPDAGTRAMATPPAPTQSTAPRRSRKTRDRDRDAARSSRRTDKKKSWRNQVAISGRNGTEEELAQELAQVERRAEAAEAALQAERLKRAEILLAAERAERGGAVQEAERALRAKLALADERARRAETALAAERAPRATGAETAFAPRRDRQLAGDTVSTCARQARQ